MLVNKFHSFSVIKWKICNKRKIQKTKSLVSVLFEEKMFASWKIVLILTVSIVAAVPQDGPMKLENAKRQLSEDQQLRRELYQQNPQSQQQLRRELYQQNPQIQQARRNVYGFYPGPTQNQQQRMADAYYPGLYPSPTTVLIISDEESKRQLPQNQQQRREVYQQNPQNQQQRMADVYYPSLYPSPTTVVIISDENSKQMQGMQRANIFKGLEIGGQGNSILLCDETPPTAQRRGNNYNKIMNGGTGVMNNIGGCVKQVYLDEAIKQLQE
jgi:hypothetical protein